VTLVEILPSIFSGFVFFGGLFVCGHAPRDSAYGTILKDGFRSIGRLEHQNRGKMTDKALVAPMARPRWWTSSSSLPRSSLLAL
jgi:hypothetical protein